MPLQLLRERKNASNSLSIAAHTYDALKDVLLSLDTMVTLHCPSCGTLLTIESIDGMTLRWNSITCSNPKCRATIAVHLRDGAIYFKWEKTPAALISKEPWKQLTQLQSELQVI
jgi:hypothetical protein